MKKIIAGAGILMCFVAFSLALAQVDTTAAIKILSTWVPRDQFIVYLGVGHSNMAGRDLVGTDNIPHPRCWNFKIDSHPENQVWVLAKPVIHWDGYDAAGNGPWISFLKTMAGKYPNHYFGVITNPGFGNALCRDYQPGQGMYNELIGSAKKLVGKCTFGGVLMMEGITDPDRMIATNARAFSMNALIMMTAIRGDLKSPYIPLFACQYEAGATGSYSPNQTIPQIVISEIWKIPSVVKYSFAIPSDGIPIRDTHHYTNAGYAMLTSRVIDSMLAHKWFPDASTAGAANRVARSSEYGCISVKHKGFYQISLFISFPGPVKNPSVSFFNSSGELIQGQSQFTGSQLRYTVSGRSGGLYFAKVEYDGGSFVKKIVLAH